MQLDQVGRDPYVPAVSGPEAPGALGPEAARDRHLAERGFSCGSARGHSP